MKPQPRLAITLDEEVRTDRAEGFDAGCFDQNYWFFSSYSFPQKIKSVTFAKKSNIEDFVPKKLEVVFEATFTKEN